MNTCVVARRWDGLGGRLQALLNARSVARALDIDFRLVWPRSTFIELSEPLELFSAAFLDRFEIAETDGGGAVLRPDLKRMSIPQALDLCRSEAVSLLDMDECFDVFAFAGESAENAQKRFAAGLGEIGWGATVQALIHSIAKQSSDHGYSALHIRAGDIVTGDWRQFVPVDKYLPTPLVEFAIATLSGPDHQPVVIVSDNEPYVRHLKTRFRMLRSPDDLISGYAQLTDLQRAFADILILSHARQLAGPCQSAFSRLAANLGNLPLPRINEWIAEGDARRLLRDSIARTQKQGAQPEVLRPLLARDICWFLDVFLDEFSLADQNALATQAVQLDPNFCGALNRSALARALADDRPDSEAKTIQARVLAARSDRHADPMFETLATSMAASALLWSSPKRGRARSVMLEEVRRTLAQCEALAPFQIQHPDVMLNLRLQVSTLAWLTAADDPLRRKFSIAMQQAEDEEPFLSAWRPSGYDALGWAGFYPQVLRNLEVVTIRMARALGTALSHFSKSSRPPAMGQTDDMLTSPSGLRWIRGWALDTRISRHHLAIGYVRGGAIVSGGVTFLPRPDVARVINDPAASMSGFAFPVPRAVTDLGENRRAHLRVTPRTGIGPLFLQI